MNAVAYYYPDVDGLGNVAVTRHAQARAAELGIDEAAFFAALGGAEVPDAGHVVWRESNGVRVIVNRRPVPYSGAAVAITVLRVRKNLSAKESTMKYACYCCGRFVFDWTTVLMKGKDTLCRSCRNDPRPPETCHHGDRTTKVRSESRTTR